jgi:hypothetical protein
MNTDINCHCGLMMADGMCTILVTRIWELKKKEYRFKLEIMEAKGHLENMAIDYRVMWNYVLYDCSVERNKLISSVKNQKMIF